MADNTLQNGTSNIATDDIGGVHYQRVKLTAGIDGVANDIGIEPFAALQVNNGFQTLFYDAWAGALDTTEKWTTTGNPPTISGGMMSMSVTAASYNTLRTKDVIRSNVGFTLVRNGISIETATATGAGRFWGLGIVATTPLPGVLAQDGIGFEIDQMSGSLLAVTYVAGARTTVATLTRPTDGAIHAYGMYFRVTQAYWIIDGVTVATQSFPNVQVVDLPALIVRQNAAAFTGTPVFNNIAHLTADSSRQGMTVADPIIGTRQARVNAAGALAVNQQPTTLVVTATAATGVAVTATLPAAGVGQFHYITAIEITKFATAAVAGNATPVLVTTTNLAGNPTYTLPSAQPIGSTTTHQPALMTPIKSTVANTATTIVCPVSTTIIWRVNVYYYTGF